VEKGETCFLFLCSVLVSWLIGWVTGENRNGRMFFRTNYGPAAIDGLLDQVAQARAHAAAVAAQSQENQAQAEDDAEKDDNADTVHAHQKGEEKLQESELHAHAHHHQRSDEQKPESSDSNHEQQQSSPSGAVEVGDVKAAGAVAVVEEPRLEQFLDDEDLLPECRSDNQRLIDYLTQDHIITQLIDLSTRRPGGAQNAITTSNIAQEVKNTDMLDAEDHAKRRFKWPYMASEVLAAEVERISDAVLASSRRAHLDSLLEFLDASPGSLDLFLCMHFGKVFNALLRTQHLRLLEEISKRKAFIGKLVSHVSSSPVAEILVRLLDGPESEEYNANGNPPAHAAVALLTDCDVLQKLSSVFHDAASEQLHLERLSSSSPPSSATANNREASDDDASSAELERYREETMESVTNTVVGITMKVLRMPVMKLEVPRGLNVYGNPEVVGRMLDGGIEAARRKMPSSALGYALKLVTELMTTDANLAPEEPDEEEVTMFQMMSYMSPPGRRNFLSGSLTPQRGARNRGGPMGIGRGSSLGMMGAGGVANTDKEEDRNNNSTPRVQIMNTRLLEEACACRFQSLLELLVRTNTNADVINTSGRVELLGSTRLRLVEFFVAFLKRGNERTLRKLVELKVPEELLKLCLLHSWNSMVHGVVASSISGALKYGSVDTINSTWLSANLVSWVVHAWKKNAAFESADACHFRAGYMGSLIVIAKELDVYLDKMEPSEREMWVAEEVYESFKALVNGELKEVMEREAVLLGGKAPGGDRVVSDDEEEMYEEATEVLDMEDVIGGLTSGDNDAINLFANYLFQRGGVGTEFEEEEGVETIDVSEFENSPDDAFNLAADVAVALDETASNMHATGSRAAGNKGEEEEESGGENDDDDDDEGSYERFVASPEMMEVSLPREGSETLLAQQEQQQEEAAVTAAGAHEEEVHCPTPMPPSSASASSATATTTTAFGVVVGGQSRSNSSGSDTTGGGVVVDAVSRKKEKEERGDDDVGAVEEEKSKQQKQQQNMEVGGGGDGAHDEQDEQQDDDDDDGSEWVAFDAKEDIAAAGTTSTTS